MSATVSTMKCLVLLPFLAMLVLARNDHVNGEEDFLHMVRARLAKLFGIPVKDVAGCMLRTGVTEADLRMFEDALSDETIANEDGTRRASCTLSCCAQARGIINDSKIDVSVIYKIIDDTELTPHVKYKYYTPFYKCAESVAERTGLDECNLFFHYMKCLVAYDWDV